ncbi:hypothetical protein LMH87_009533 [Akanthomyces muscarius]|uniref:Heterokaryon incompatibility domain-containing protein n=1 Tax=Akanthomyces muscarius TaxID=2231603 RepID=A0A9W8QD45_AKAMU|nr:hypothetical protein LMH87_009533 [Akanthomyces muscarius]KAJ4153022.1 hypothetical protein LMH87_009533 [Akanthomyces muscarius]
MNASSIVVEEDVSIYAYKPLQNKDDFRLVTVLPGLFEDKIILKISHNSETGLLISSWTHPIETINPSLYFQPNERREDYGPKFEALSYTWGSALHPETVYIATETSFSKLSIRQNLASALRHLRYPDKPRTIWADALCINQLDVNERNQQVSRMVDIYPRAQRVLAWLGPDSVDVSYAMRALDFLGSQVITTVDNSTIFAPEATERQWDHRTVLPYDRGTWMGIAQLLNRDYFKRLWVVQEIQLAREVIMRDLVYGLLGLLPASFSFRIEPRYGLPVGHAYKEVMLAYIEHAQRLDFFEACSLARREKTGTPSWVPDFSAPPAVGREVGMQLAAGYSRCWAEYRWEEQLQQEILKVAGVQCARITHVSKTIPVNDNLSETLADVRAMEPDKLDMAPLYITVSKSGNLVNTGLPKRSVWEMGQERNALS